MAVDAVVNPGQFPGIMGAGVAGALSRRAGRASSARPCRWPRFAVGAAVVTNAGQLWAKFVIHAPTMETGHEGRRGKFRRATRAALLAAAHHSFEVICTAGMAPPRRVDPPMPRGRWWTSCAPTGTQADHVYLVDLRDGDPAQPRGRAAGRIRVARSPPSRIPEDVVKILVACKRSPTPDRS